MALFGVLRFSDLPLANYYTVVQGSQTRGPRAACSPQNCFVRPAATWGGVTVAHRPLRLAAEAGWTVA